MHRGHNTGRRGGIERGRERARNAWRGIQEAAVAAVVVPAAVTEVVVAVVAVVEVTEVAAVVVVAEAVTG